MTTNSSEEGRTAQGTLLSLSSSRLKGIAADTAPWDNSDPFISAYLRDLIQTVLKCYVRQLIIFVGIPGNAFTCLVFLKQGLSDRINLLLFWLGLADLLHLLSQLLLMPGCYLQDSLQVGNWATISNTKTAYLTIWSSSVSATLIVGVSVDRCLSVALPLRAGRMLTYRSTAAAIVLSYAVPLLFCLPCLLAFQVSWRTDPATNGSMAFMDDASWFPLDSRVAVKVTYYFSLVAKPIFLVIMIVCCTITVAILRRASRQRKQMVGRSMITDDSKESRITLMLLSICVAYIVLAIPEMCSAVIVTFVPEYYVFSTYHNTFIVHYQFIWIASCLNSAINFFAYLLLSSRFQKTLKDLVVCWKWRGS